MIKRFSTWPAIAAMCFLAFWPAAVLSLAFAGVGTASIWCSETPALTLTDDDRARLADLAQLLDDDPAHEQIPMDCPDCQTPGTVVLPQPVIDPVSIPTELADQPVARRSSVFIQSPRGPPNGSRAPPVFVL